MKWKVKLFKENLNKKKKKDMELIYLQLKEQEMQWIFSLMKALLSMIKMNFILNIKFRRIKVICYFNKMIFKEKKTKIVA